MNNTEIIFYTTENNKVKISLDKNKVYKPIELLNIIDNFFNKNNNIVFNSKNNIYFNNINIDMSNESLNKYSNLKIVFQNCIFKDKYLPFYYKEVYLIYPKLSEYTDIFIEKENQTFLISTNEKNLITINKNNKINKDKITILGNYNNLIINVKASDELSLSSKIKGTIKVNVDNFNISNSTLDLKDSVIKYSNINGKNYTIKSSTPLLINNSTFINNQKELILTNKDLNEEESILLARKKFIKELHKINETVSKKIDKKVEEEYEKYHPQFERNIKSLEKQIEVLKEEIEDIKDYEIERTINAKKKLKKVKIKTIRND